MINSYYLLMVLNQPCQYVYQNIKGGGGGGNTPALLLYSLNDLDLEPPPSPQKIFLFLAWHKSSQLAIQEAPLHSVKCLFGIAEQYCWHLPFLHITLYYKASVCYPLTVILVLNMFDRNVYYLLISYSIVLPEWMPKSCN